jgi:4-aminobutyrate aminotransferase-like enzyme
MGGAYIAADAGGAPSAAVELRAWSTGELLEARAKHCGANVALNYRKAPLHLVKGRAQFLYDAEGAEYLDCVNNVCHVGHCHPDVAAEACQQLCQLNTNARYLSAHVLDYAQRLTATLPESLCVVYWTNSGSEANDLALRLARAHTKRRGVLCVGGAYHGHVSSMVDASPYKFERESGGQRCVTANIDILQLRHI